MQLNDVWTFIQRSWYVLYILFILMCAEKSTIVLSTSLIHEFIHSFRLFSVQHGQLSQNYCQSHDLTPQVADQIHISAQTPHRIIYFCKFSIHGLNVAQTEFFFT